MTIFEKQYNGNWYDYFRISLELPKFRYGKYTESIDTGKRFEIRFNTIFIFDKTDGISWYICFKVLGFGISITRQWGY